MDAQPTAPLPGPPRPAAPRPGAPRSTEFGPLRIGWDDRVLEPRPWTTAQAEWGAALLTAGPRGDVLELCAGAGQIGLLTALGAGRALVMVDADPVACAWARTNAAARGGDGRVEVRCSPLEEALTPRERFALVQADPPWVPSDLTGQHPRDPLRAIDGGPAGLDVAVVCLQVAAGALLPGGSVLLQLGTEAQVDALGPDAARLGLALQEVRTFPRGVVAHYRPAAVPGASGA
ncbi:methyltransferase [Nocardioides nanhaiensis]|uniref:Methyltransferase small domain-containing protein n=1 Tax=Nocardioides nanhaiensis TaxID=1476871 RepID=A0ABP8WC35_9ACTN